MQKLYYASVAGGAINIAGDSTSVTINGSVISGNISNFGGAINAWNCELQLNDCNLTDNSSQLLGGSIRAGFSKIEIDSTNFERDTTGSSGGGVYVIHCDLFIANSEFNSNSATNYGGALRSDSSSVMLSNSKFEKNLALWGGGVYNTGSEFYIHDCEFTENSAEYGGAVYTEFGNIQLSNIAFVQNSSGWGGAIRSFNTNIQIDSCLFSQNSANNNSGAIDYDIDTLNISPPYQFKAMNSRFIENSAIQYYGAIKILQPDFGVSLVNVFIDKCEFENNTSNRSGAIRLDGNIWDFVISNSVFSKNSAGTQSACAFWRGVSGKIYNCLFNSNITSSVTPTGLGSIVLSNNSNVDFINCTVVNNIGITSGGLKIQSTSGSKVINSIFWGNYPDQISLQSPNETSVSSIYLDYNDIQYGIDSIKLYDTISVLNWGVGNINSYPLFEDTLNSDYHLQNVSPCIGVGIDSIEIAGFWYHCPSTDIEGQPRPFPIGTMPDMGAYEFQNPVGVKGYDTNLPAEYALHQNYPNPFNPTTTIGFSIMEKGNVRMSILNILGEEIRVLLSVEKEAGYHSVDFNASELPSGVYFYQLQSGKFTAVNKMLLLR